MHFILFGCIWDSLLHYNTQFKTGQTGAKVRAMKSCRNFSQQTHPIHPIGPLPHVSVRVILFGCIWYSCCVTTLSSKRAKLVQKFVPRSRVTIFRYECTWSNPLDSKLTFGVFCTIWVHLVPFGYLTKLGTKRAEVVQNFVRWSRVGIFHNKPLDPPH